MIYFFAAVAMAAPPREMPPELASEYTLGGEVPVREWYIDNSMQGHPIVFQSEEINELMIKALRKELGYYGKTDEYLYAMLKKYGTCIAGKKVAIIGSQTPWYEAIILAFGGHPITIEYQNIQCTDPRCQAMTPAEYDQNPFQFDAIVSISSLEHDGLGRYGDPLNPKADLDMMQKMRTMLREGGLLFLSIPVGEDAIYWNAHRVYGTIRLPLLCKDWERVDSSGFLETDLYFPGYSGHQPVFVLRPH